MHAGAENRRAQHVSFAGTVHQQPDPPTDLHNSSHYASSSSNSSPARSDLDATLIEPMHTTTVPLSSVPCQALGVKTAEEKAQKQGKAGHGSMDASTAVSNKTGRLSQLMEAEKAKAEELKLQFNRPKQVTGRSTKYHKALAWAGRIGWCGKAVVYAMIGGLACQSAVGNNRPDPNLPQTEQVAASPQGAFVLLGTTAQGVDIVMLLIMLVALAAYITWRFWEGLAGQGYDETFSSKKNFFKFRVSPIVSGCVYVSYMVFLITVIDREVRNVPTTTGPQKEGWPSTWRHNAGGRVGLALLGIAFTIATCIQLQGVLTKQWHRDYRSDLPKPLMLAVFTVGHFGFAGRAGAFLAMGVMFFKDAGGADTPHQSSMVANALLQLQDNRGLRAILMIVGILLVTYGLFATLSAFTRMFPTPPPSRRKRLPAAEFKEHQQRKEERRNARKRRWGLPLHHPHAHNHGHGSWPELNADGEHPSSSPHPAVDGDAAADARAGGRVTSDFGAGPNHTAINMSQPGAASKLRYPPPAASASAAVLAGHDRAGSGLATAESMASTSSIPIAVDASPGWGKDQGLTNSSLDLDQVSKKSGSKADLAQLSKRSGSETGTGFKAPPRSGSRSWRGSGRSMFVLPSQRGRAAVSDAGQVPGAVPAAGSGSPELGPLALAGEPAVSGSLYSRGTQQGADERASDRGFVAVDL